jgi:WD40 repeat protein
MLMEDECRIFISYRRSDAAGHARALHRDLCRRFDRGLIFFDRSSIESGDVFPERLHGAIEQCSVLLALIAPSWLDAKGSDGQPRIGNPDDLVRQEISQALALGKTVIPVLFDDEPVPDAGLLPEPLKPLTACDALTMRGKDYEYDAQLAELVRKLAESPGIPAPRADPYQDGAFRPIVRASLREAFKPLIEERTKIFGGRDAVFARIDDFIGDDTGGYLVITAPAGFGKTALVANLISERPEAFAYHFFTPLYGEESLSEDRFLRNVIQQMAEWHGHGGDMPTGIDELQALFHKLIDAPLDTTQVLVLDGLDEVTDWRLQPYLSRKLPRNLHIIMTVRDVGQDWQDDFKFPAEQRSHLPLGGLGSDEVADVLRSMGAEGAAFAEDAKLLGEVTRIAAYEEDPALGADPFYVRFLAEDIRAGHVTPTTIARQPQRLEDYLKEWWKDIKRLAGDIPTRELFGTLAAALGPLSRTDLEAVCPSLADEWAGDFFDEVLTKVRRLVIGNDDRGYALAHPRLRRYIADPKHIGNIDNYRDRLRAFCAGWQDHGSAYTFAHYPTHLAEAGEEVALRILLLDYQWIAAKLEATDITAVIIDCDRISGDASLGAVKDALVLSDHVLADDKSQLAGQLIGRLRGFDLPHVQKLVGAAGRRPGRPWLHPQTPSLTPPGGPLLRTLVGHAGPVRTVAVMADGRQALSGSGDCTLRLWDMKTGKPLRSLEGHADEVSALANLVDGRRVLSGSHDGTLRLWGLETGQSLRTLEGHTGPVSAVSVLADGRRAVSGSGDKTLRLWDLETVETQRTLESHSSWVFAVAELPDGRRALSGSDDCTLRLWDLETGENLRTLKGHELGITALAVLPKGRRAVSGSFDGTLRLWDLETGETLRTLQGCEGPVMAVTVVADGRRALSGSWNGMLRLWDLETGESLRALQGHGGAVVAVAALPDGRRALSGSGNGALQLWDLEREESGSSLKGHAEKINAVAVLPDGRRGLSGSDDGTLRLWDLETGESLCTLQAHTHRVTAVAVLEDGCHALSGSWDRTLRLWDLETGETLRTLQGQRGAVFAVTVLADGRRGLSGSGYGTMRLWDLETTETLRTLQGHTHRVTAIAVLADGHRALSGSWDHTLQLWNLETGKTLHTLQGHTHRVTAITVLADGRRALSGSWDKTLRLWDLETGDNLRTLQGHTDHVLAVSVLADGRRALSGSNDGTLRLWDLESGEVIATFTGDAAITCVAVARDDLFVAGSANGALHILRLIERTAAKGKTPRFQ